MRLSASGVAHAGIIYAAKDTRSIGEIIFGIVRVWELMEPHEMAGRIQFL